jgi:carboxymethylenebutenolidase
MKRLVSLIISVFLVTSLGAQDFALKQLEESPRHQEWVRVLSGDRSVHAFVVYPEVSHNATAVIVIHENRGLTDWVRSFADQLAAEGYIAIAPDLLSDFDSEHSKTGDFANQDAARDALYQLDPDQITQDLKMIQAFISNDPASNGKVVVAGFCWGGTQSFLFATNARSLSASLVFYGTATNDEDAISRIESPVYGFYGGNDQRVNSTIASTKKLMDANSKSFDYRIYEGAGHGYMRTGDDPAGSEANISGRNDTWKWVREILSGI